MKVAMVMVKGEQPKNCEHLLVVDRDEAALLIVMADEYCRNHKQAKKAKKLSKELEDNLGIY